MRIIVTGGMGDLGSRVVADLTARGHEAVVASRRTGVDLASGAGLADALAGADGVVHCATSPARPKGVDIGGARRIVEALRVMGGSAARTHLVGVSIVGCDLNPYPYYRAKHSTEEVLADSGLPATVVRATQFHALAAFMAGLRVGPLGVRIGDMAIQPVDIDFVAKRLVDLVTGGVPDGFRRAADLAGPDLLEVAQISALVAAHDGRRAPHLLRLPPVGGTMRSFSARTNVPSGPVEIGGASFAEWLAGQPRPLPRGPHHAR